MNVSKNNCYAQATCLLDLFANFHVLHAELKHLQVILESSNGHADRRLECRSTDASWEAVRDGSSDVCLNALHTSHGEACIPIDSLAASQRAEVVNVHYMGRIWVGYG
jgi:hypothetical protein